MIITVIHIKGFLDEMAEFWGKVATEFKSFSNILGYEIINEPWAGIYGLQYIVGQYIINFFS